MRRLRPSIILVLLLLTASAAAGEAPSEAPIGSCVDQLLRRVSCSNPQDVCRILTKGRDPTAGANLEQYEFRSQDLGDGTEAFVFEHATGGDDYAYRPSFHFARRGDRLELIFDGGGLPVSYATNRSRVNGRWQIRRTSQADIPGLYRKREVEVWFWSGDRYLKAFSRMTIEGATDPSLNGTQWVWNPEAEAVYKSSGPSWSYVVKQGDTLSGIARRHGVGIKELQRQNGIRNAGSLRLGQTIRYEGWKVNAR